MCIMDSYRSEVFDLTQKKSFPSFTGLQLCRASSSNKLKQQEAQGQESNVWCERRWIVYSTRIRTYSFRCTGEWRRCMMGNDDHGRKMMGNDGWWDVAAYVCVYAYMCCVQPTCDSWRSCRRLLYSDTGPSLLTSSSFILFIICQIFVLAAVVLHVFAFAAWGVLFVSEQRQPKLKSKMFWLGVCLAYIWEGQNIVQ